MKQSWKWKFLTPLHFLCGGRLPGGMSKNNHIWIGRCLVVMVTALDDVGLRTLFWPENSLSKSKSKQVWFSAAREPIQMKLTQIIEPLLQFIKLAIKVFRFIIKKTLLVLLCCLPAIFTGRKNKPNHIRNFSENTAFQKPKLAAELT